MLVIYQRGASCTVCYIRPYDLLKLLWYDDVFIRQNFLINVNSSHDENISSGSTLFCTDPNNVQIERAPLCHPSHTLKSRTVIKKTTDLVFVPAFLCSLYLNNNACKFICPMITRSKLSNTFLILARDVKAINITTIA